MAFILFACAAAAAASGGRPGEIFNFGAGARPLGMGSAYTAVAMDATAVYYNPAGLGMLPNRSVSFMHASLFEGAAYDYMGYAQNFRALPGAWGAQVMRLSAGSVPGRDEFNNETSAFTYSETAFAFAGGVRGLFLPSLSVGTGIKVLNRSLANSSDRLLGMDLGLQYGPLFNGRAAVGLVVQNALGFKTGDTEDRLPLNVRAGALFHVIPGVALAADISGSGEFRVGTEYAIGLGALRLGYDRQAVSFGGGMKLMKSYQLDVAMIKHPELGMSQRVSLGYQFGGRGMKETRPELFAKDFLALARKDLDSRKYVKALEDINRAIGLDPKLKREIWGEKQKKLSALLSAMGINDSPAKQKILEQTGEQQEMGNEAVKAYLEGQFTKSMLFAHAALGTNTKEAFFEELLGSLGRLTGTPVKREEILSKQALIQEKHKKGAMAFYIQKFEVTIKECEEVLLLDEGNVLAWTRLGSSYFAMGDKDRAQKAYERVLELNPEDKTVLEFMKIQGWK